MQRHATRMSIVKNETPGNGNVWEKVRDAETKHGCQAKGLNKKLLRDRTFDAGYV